MSLEADAETQTWFALVRGDDLAREDAPHRRRRRAARRVDAVSPRSTEKKLTTPRAASINSPANRISSLAGSGTGWAAHPLFP
jgi:hypothetical protein